MKNRKKILWLAGIFVVVLVGAIFIFRNNKTVVTLNCYTMDEISDEVEAAVNKEFKKQGLNFEINFTMGMEAPKQLDEMLHPIDLMQCYAGTETDFISLEPFLKTEEGKKLNDAYTENEWKLYSCDGSKERKLVGSKTFYGARIAYSVDQTMMEKLNWSKEKFQLPLSSVIPFLENVEQSEVKSPIYQNLPLHEIWAPYYEAVTGYYTIVIKKSEENVKAVNFFEEPLVQDYLLSLYQIGQKSWGSYTPNSAMAAPNHTFSLVEYTTDEWMNIVNPEVTGKYYIPITDGYLGPNFYKNALGIRKQSNHPEEAFRAMVEIYTNPTISTLIQCGIEGINYKMEDGYVVPLTNFPNLFSNSMSLMVLGNYSLTPPLKGEPMEKQTAIEEYNAKLKVPSILGFVFDTTKVKREIEAVAQVYLDNGIRNKSLACGTYQGDDPEGELQRIIAELKKAGIDEVITECNRQLDVFYSQK